MRHILAAALVALAACSRPVQTARTSVIQPPSPAELEAEVTVRNAACSPNWSYLFPGLGQLCLRQVGEGGALALAGAAELSTAVIVGRETELGFEHPGAVLPLIGLQDLWVYSVADVSIQKQLARRELYAPTDRLGSLVAAPFNWEVMKRPSVWVGILGALAVGVGASLAVDQDVDTDSIGDDPNLFGRELSPGIGYPAGFGIGAALFTHVGIAEEALFRGLLQSSLARGSGETNGWLVSSLVFGLVHAPNALTLESAEERREYLMYGLPVITVLGSYLGWIYKESDYSLGPPVAVHFWYDLLLTSTFFVLEPDRSPLSASITFRF